MHTIWSFIGVIILLTISVLSAACAPVLGPAAARWSDEELAKIEDLWIGSLPPLPADPSNRYADDLQAAKFGQKLFFDTRFSLNGKVACSTCHLPERSFQDDRSLAQGVGTTNRRTMPIAGTAYSPWLFWDGRKDSQWAQALGPLENPVEHGGNRTRYAHLVAQHYAAEYEAVFGPLPDLAGLPPDAGPVDDEAARSAWEAMPEEDREAVTQVYANLGKAIAAYERRLLPGEARFDRYAAAVLQGDLRLAGEILSADEIAGLKLFIGEARCTNCHSGPLFTNHSFHNTGVPLADGLPEDTGRYAGVEQVRGDEFNCLSRYSDARPEQCAELNFLVEADEHLIRQYKPPSLRGAAWRPPYMHAGQYASLEDVLDHYKRAPAAPAGESELEPLDLSDAQLDQIIAFLKTLDAPIAAGPEWLGAP